MNRMLTFSKLPNFTKVLSRSFTKVSTLNNHSIELSKKKFGSVEHLFNRVRGLEGVAEKLEGWEGFLDANRFKLKELGFSASVRRKVLKLKHKVKLGEDVVKVKKHKSTSLKK